MEETVNNMILKVVIKIENLFIKIPYSIEDESMEETLNELSNLLEYRSKDEFVKRPYSGLDYEAKLLSDLSRALRIRMEQMKTINVSGVEYFDKRLEEFLEKLRFSLGFNPYIPLSYNERFKKNYKPNTLWKSLE